MGGIFRRSQISNLYFAIEIMGFFFDFFGFLEFFSFFFCIFQKSRHFRVFPKKSLLENSAQIIGFSAMGILGIFRLSWYFPQIPSFFRIFIPDFFQKFKGEIHPWFRIWGCFLWGITGKRLATQIFILMEGLTSQAAPSGTCRFTLLILSHSSTLPLYNLYYR